MSESDEWATVETVHDEDGQVEAPAVAIMTSTSALDQAFSFTYENGWYIIISAVLLYYLCSKLYEKTKCREDYRPLKKNEEIISRHEAMLEARRRLQELHDAKAREHAVKVKEKEELAHQQKLRDLEKYGSSLGRKSGHGNEPDEVPKRKPVKSTLRQEYNPLMGGDSSSCFRPARRGAAGGG